MKNRTFIKLLYAFLSVIILFCSVSFCLADTENSLMIYSRNPADNNILSVPVKIQNCSGIISLVITVEYNSQNVSLFEVQNGSFFSSTPSTSKDFSSNPYKIYWENSLKNDIYGSGLLCTLKFNVITTENPDIRVRVLECFNKKYQDVSFNSTVTSEEAERYIEENDAPLKTKVLSLNSETQNRSEVSLDKPDNMENITVHQKMKDGSVVGVDYAEKNDKLTFIIDADTETVTISGTIKNPSKTTIQPKLYYSVLGAIVVLLAVGITIHYKLNIKRNKTRQEN